MSGQVKYSENSSGTQSSWSWLNNISEIAPGNSAVLSGNYFVFYGIHTVAIILLLTSLTSCLIVIFSILRNQRKDRWDFSDRFPLYLAIADELWGISHLTDHFVLITTRTYPDSVVATAMSVNLWFFIGYQQLMHAGLATYTYLKIVRQVQLDLGKGEWRLHLFCFGMMGLSVAIFYPLGAFGCSGYWFLNSVKSTAGIILGLYMAVSATVHALCTTVGYRSIKRVVEKHNEAMKSYDNSTQLKSSTLHSTATERLNTFVLISVGLYTPLAIVAWALVVQVLNGFMEPLTVLFITIAANSSGWANALGYFHNNRIKARREAEKKKYSIIPTISTNSAHSSK